MTVTQTVTNNLGTVLLQPVAQLFSTPSDLTSYTTLMGCSGALSCAVVNNGSGQPIGYQAALMNPLSALGGSVPLNLLTIGLPYTFTSSRTLSVSRDLNPANDSDSTDCLAVSRLLVLCS